MISIYEATNIIQDHLPDKQTEIVDLQNSLGFVSSEDIFAPEPSPRYTNSAMDGFALQWEDVQATTQKNPVSLKIVGETQAGIPFKGKIKSGETVKISTGAMIADGADTVVPIEEVEATSSSVKILKAKKQGQNLRYTGEEFDRGELLIPKGVEIQPPQIALLASVGKSSLSVYIKPYVAIVVTGTELVPFDKTAQPWQIRDSNSIMLSSAIKQSGGQVKSIYKVPDSQEQTIQLLEQISSQSNLVLFSGGVSVGPHDHIKEAVKKVGFETLFWRVAIKPGKPLLFAKKGDTILFGLPGNPVSALMCYIYFIHPIIRNLCGKVDQIVSVQAELQEPLKKGLNRTHLMRVQIKLNSQNKPVVYPLEKQGSHMLTSIANANGFMLIGAEKSFNQDDLVDVFLFPWEDFH